MYRLLLFLYLFPAIFTIKCYKGTYYRGTDIVDCPLGCYHYREDRLGFARLFWDMWYQRVGCRDKNTVCQIKSDPAEPLYRRANCCLTDLCNPIEDE